MWNRPQQGVTLTGLTTRAEWANFLAAFPGATSHHCYDFLESVAAPLRCKFIPSRVVSGDRPIGIAPLLVKQLGPFSTINWVPFPYLGPLVPPEFIPATLSALRLEARRRRALNHQQSFSYAVTDCGADGFTSTTDRTFVIPLSGRSDEDLLAAMHTNRRRGIRYAQRLGLEVGPAKTGDFPLMDAWLSQVYTAQGLSSPYPAGAYEQLFHTFRNTSGWEFTASRLDGQARAVLITLSTNRCAFSWQYAADPSNRSMNAQDLLIWHAMVRARDAGAIEFDLVGSPNNGVAEYKRRFGALERNYTVLQRQTRSHRVANASIKYLRRGTA